VFVHADRAAPRGPTMAPERCCDPRLWCTPYLVALVDDDGRIRQKTDSARQQRMPRPSLYAIRSMRRAISRPRSRRRVLRWRHRGPYADRVAFLMFACKAGADAT
jgi:hypothetical protein